MNLQLSTPVTPGLPAARVPTDLFAHRALATSLLGLLRAADPDAAPDLVTVSGPRGLPSTWTRTGTAPCSLCLRTRSVLTSDDAPHDRAQFCPECWTLDLYDTDGAHVAHASAWCERLMVRFRPGAAAAGVPLGAPVTDLDRSRDADPGEPS